MLPTGTLLRSCLMVMNTLPYLGTLAYFTEKSRTSCQLLPFFTCTLFLSGTKEVAAPSLILNPSLPRSGRNGLIFSLLLTSTSTSHPFQPHITPHYIHPIHPLPTPPIAHHPNVPPTLLFPPPTLHRPRNLHCSPPPPLPRRLLRHTSSHRNSRCAYLPNPRSLGVMGRDVGT